MTKKPIRKTGVFQKARHVSALHTYVLSGWQLYDAMYDATGTKTTPATLIHYLRICRKNKKHGKIHRAKIKSIGLCRLGYGLVKEANNASTMGNGFVPQAHYRTIRHRAWQRVRIMQKWYWWWPVVCRVLYRTKKARNDGRLNMKWGDGNDRFCKRLGNRSNRVYTYSNFGYLLFYHGWHNPRGIGVKNDTKPDNQMLYKMWNWIPGDNGVFSAKNGGGLGSWCRKCLKRSEPRISKEKTAEHQIRAIWRKQVEKRATKPRDTRMKESEATVREYNGMATKKTGRKE